MKEITREQAVALAKSGIIELLPDEDIVKFQLFTDRLCMDFGRFHEAVEKVLGRSVWTHEFGTVGMEQLRREFLGEKKPPTFEEIINLIPEQKLLVIEIEEG